MSVENINLSILTNLKREFLDTDHNISLRRDLMENFIELGGQLDKELIYSLAKSISEYTKALYWDKKPETDDTLANAAAFIFLKKVPIHLHKYAHQKLEEIPLVTDNKELYDLHYKIAGLATYFRSTSQEKV